MQDAIAKEDFELVMYKNKKRKDKKQNTINSRISMKWNKIEALTKKPIPYYLLDIVEMNSK